MLIVIIVCDFEFKTAFTSKCGLFEVTVNTVMYRKVSVIFNQSRDLNNLRPANTMDYSMHTFCT